MNNYSLRRTFKNTILCILLLVICQLAHAQDKQTYRIGMMVDSKTTKTEKLIDKLISEVQAVVGEDAITTFPTQYILANNFNVTKAQENYKTLLDGDVDIILAIGAASNLVVQGQEKYAKPTILFGAINTDLNKIDFTQSTSGVKNFTYLMGVESFEADLKTFKELTNFTNLGIAMEKGIVETLPLNQTFGAILGNTDASFRIIPFENMEDITNDLQDLDALYLAGGFLFSQEEIKALADMLIKRKIPSFTNQGVNYVEQGIMGTNNSEDTIEQIMRRIALTIEAYVTGNPLADQKVFIDFENRLTINYNTAEATGVPIKYSLIATTDFVGEFKNVLSGKQYNLLEIINGVLDKNLGLQAAQKDVEISGQNIKTAVSNYLPNLTANANGTYTDPKLAEVSLGQSPEFQTAGNLTLQQTLFSEAANANISIQKSLQKAQQESFNTDQLNTIFNASNAYFNTLILKANAQIQMRNLDLTKRNLQIAQQNFDAGQSGKSDLLRFRSQMAQNMQTMVEAVNQLEQSFISLNQLLNNPVDTEIDIVDVELDKGVFEEYNYNQLFQLLDDPTLREPFIAFLVEEAKANAPELKALGYNLKATERNIKLNGYGRFLPTVALQGQYNNIFSRSGKGSTAGQGITLLDNNYNIGLNVSIPVLNRNQTNIDRQTALIQQNQLTINKENTELSIAANIRNGVLNLVNQISNIELSKVSEETAKEALELTQTAYSNGAVNIIQLLDAQNNYLNAQLARTNAAYNYLINALQLERFLGYYFLLNTEAQNNAFRQRFIEFTNTQN